MKNRNAKVVVTHNSRPSSPRKVGMRGIGAAPHLYPALQACGMTKCVARQGFTLIELLVVVLIVGILAAVAVPQYQFAVMKAKMRGILPLMISIKEATELYYLEKGEYTENLSLLNIEIPPGEVQNNPQSGFMCYKNGTCFDSFLYIASPSHWVIVGGIGSSSQGDSGDSCFISLWLDHSPHPGLIECGKSRSTHPQCARLCKSLGYK